MNAAKRKTLESRGYKVYDHAGDAVGLTEEEKQLLDLRVKLARMVRQCREQLHLSQQDLATRLRTTQPRVVRIEQAAPDVSFDQFFRAYAAMGRSIFVKEVLFEPARTVKGDRKAAKAAGMQIELGVLEGK